MKFKPIFIIFIRILRPTMPQMINLTNFFTLNQIINIRNSVLKLINLWCYWIYFYYVVFDFVKSPARENKEVSLLWIFALYAIDYFIFVIVDFELLEFLCKTTTIKYSFFYYFAYILVFVIYSYLWSIVGH